MTDAESGSNPILLNALRTIAAGYKDEVINDAKTEFCKPEGHIIPKGEGAVEGAVEGDAPALSPKETAIKEAKAELDALNAMNPPASQEELDAAGAKLKTAESMEGGRRRSRRRAGKKSKNSKKSSARKSKKGGRSRRNGSKRRAHRKH